MSKQFSAQKLRELEVKSGALAEKATRLSQQIVLAEKFLQELPGKIEVVVERDILTRLEFCRFEGSWRLWFGPSDCNGELATEASVETKAKVAALLPELFEKIFTTVNNRLSEVEAGLDSLASIAEFIDPLEGV